MDGGGVVQVTFHGSLGNPVACLSPEPEIYWLWGHAFHLNASETNAPLIWADASFICHPFIRCLLCVPGTGNTEMIKTWFLPSRSSYFIRGQTEHIMTSWRDSGPRSWGCTKEELFTLSGVAEFSAVISWSVWHRRTQTLWVRWEISCSQVCYPPSPCKEWFWEPQMSQVQLSQ